MLVGNALTSVTGSTILKCSYNEEDEVLVICTNDGTEMQVSSMGTSLLVVVNNVNKAVPNG